MDSDGDGIPNSQDPALADPMNYSAYNGTYWFADALSDLDGDGINNFNDSHPYDFYNGNSGWQDSDWDGIPDSQDSWPYDPYNGNPPGGGNDNPNPDPGPDSDGDGIPDSSDSYPNDPNNNADFDSDGIPDINDPAQGDPTNTSPINGVAWYGNFAGDEDGDGVRNFWDPQPYGLAQTDSDGDGLMDNVDPVPDDAYNPSPYNHAYWPSDALGDFDGDGIPNFFDEWPFDSLNAAGDADMDGIPNATDPAPNDPANLSTINGISWYGDALGDADGDGVFNFFDYYPYGGGGGGEDPPEPPGPTPGGSGPGPGNGNGNGNGTGTGTGGGGSTGSASTTDTDGDGLMDDVDPAKEDATNLSPWNYEHWPVGALEDADDDGIPNFYDPAPYDYTNFSPHNNRPWPGVTAIQDWNHNLVLNFYDPDPESGPPYPNYEYPGLPGAWAMSPIVALNDNYDELGEVPPAGGVPVRDLDDSDLVIKGGQRVGKMATEGLTNFVLSMPPEYIAAGGKVVISQTGGTGSVRIHAVKMENGEGINEFEVVMEEDFVPPAEGDWVYWIEGVSVGPVTLNCWFPQKEYGVGGGFLSGVMDEDIVQVIDLVVAGVSLTIDGDRDGSITIGSYAEMTSAAKPFRFWINEDSDSLEIDGKGGDTDTEELIDWTKPDFDSKNAEGVREIKCQRDLEDFMMISIQMTGLNDAIQSGNVRVGLRWTNIVLPEEPTGGLADKPSVQLFRCPAGVTSTREYVSNAEKAALLVHTKMALKVDANTSDEVVWIDSEHLKNPVEIDGKSVCQFVLEGAHKGRGELEVVAEAVSRDEANGSPTAYGRVSAGGVQFKLMHAGEMTQRAYMTVGIARATPAAISDPWNYPDGVNDQVFGYKPDDKYVFQPDPDETDQCVVHVHGWRMDDAEKRNWSEMSFKRLWHQGYKGRVCAFSWPTYGPESSSLNGYLTYNLSEYRAWLAGAPLRDFVASLGFERDRIKVFAHSMGNVVVGSAIREGMVVGGYVMQHAAMAAQAYNAAGAVHTENLDSDTPDTENNTTDPSEMNRRLGLNNKFGAEAFSKVPPQGGAPVLIPVANFYLPNDSALLVWDENQRLGKPASLDVPGGYDYSRAWSESAEVDPTHSIHLKYRLENSFSTRGVYNLHEAMAYVVQARTRPIGAMAQLGGSVIQGVNLNVVYGFGSDHSAEWNRKVQATFSYWKRLMTTLDLN